MQSYSKAKQNTIKYALMILEQKQLLPDLKARATIIAIATALNNHATENA